MRPRTWDEVAERQSDVYASYNEAERQLGSDTTAERPMSEARHALEITRRMHALAASPEDQTLTLSELERLAELSAVLRSGHVAGEDADGVAGALRGGLRR